MKLAIRLTFLMLLTLTLVGSIQAGQISDNLQAKLDATSGDQPMSVWIQLESSSSSALLKAAATNSDVSRADNYLATMQGFSRLISHCCGAGSSLRSRVQIRLPFFH